MSYVYVETAESDPDLSPHFHLCWTSGTLRISNIIIYARADLIKTPEHLCVTYIALQAYKCTIVAFSIVNENDRK